VPPSNDGDLELSRRSAAGDTAAFALLVARHERPLRAFLTRMAGSQAVDDIAQAAFLNAWRSAGQYDGRARYGTWLTRIAWRCRIDQLRKERRFEPAPAAAHGACDLRAEIADMLAGLSETERAALLLCEGQGWTHEEAAGMLDMPLGTLKSAIARAKAKCRASWERDDHG
jgi:RNA polymerase sigma factor (sigma-70 family)